MNDRIIAKDRYKKVARKSYNKKQKKLASMYNINGEYKQRKIRKESIFSLTIVKIFFALLAIFLLGILSSIIIKNKEKMPIISVFFDDEGKDYIKNYDLKVGIVQNGNVSIFKSNNLIINDTYLNLATKSLVRINKDYSVDYVLAKSIKKEDKNYYITLDSRYKITADNVKTALYKILSNKENIFYGKMKCIKDVKVTSEYEIVITLEDFNPYFIYYLDFPIYIDDDISKNVKNIYYTSQIKENGNILYTNSENNGTTNLSFVSLNKYDISDDMVEAFKKNELDLMFISSDNVLKLIGKYDYGMKRYRDGKTLFLLGNTSSSMFTQKEIRQAILYSINREDIIKSLNNSYLELIDLPYLYNNLISYKYDITAANNIMLSNGWKKQGGIYTKDGRQAILNLLVNSEDEARCNIAEQIKNMVELNGIRINIERLDDLQISKRVEEKSYDIVLAEVILDETPDIGFLKDYIEVSDIIREQIQNVENSSLEEIHKNVEKLYNAMSYEVACIGIYATNTSVIYQKDIVGFEDVSYLNIFRNYDNIGKLNK